MNPAQFESLILTNIYTEEEAQQWWHEFNIKSNTTMRVRATCPKTGKVNTFKIYLRCLHQGRTEKAEKIVVNNLDKPKSVISRNTNCPADMIIAIRRVIKYSRSKLRDPVDPIHPCEIQLRFIHNHPINSAETLRFRPVSKEAEQKILSLYKDGHSPCSALDVLKFDLQTEHGALYSEILSDRYYCPDKSFCYRLYYKHFGKDYATSAIKDIHALLISKISYYNDFFKEKCVAVDKSEGNYAIAACTPLMRRCHLLTQSSDMIYVESCECPINKDNQQYNILLLYAHTPVGGVPLGTVLVTNDSIDILSIGFKLLKQLLPDKAFGSRGISGPHIFLIKDSDNQKKALNSVWPGSNVIVCIFRILQSMWEWLWDEKHNILRDHRLYLLYLLKTVLFSSSESDMTTKYQVLCSDSIVLHYPAYLEQLKCLWLKRHLWALCFHRLLPLQDANNYYEAAVRAMKDKIFEQVKSFNFIQFLNYLVTRIDLYYESKFLKILNEKIEHIFLSYFPDSIPPHIANNIKQIAGSYYVVPSENGNDKFCTIDVELNSCSCPTGLKGALCIHQHWLFLRIPPELFKANLTNTDFKQKLIMIVFGSLSLPPSIQLNNATKEDFKCKSINKSAKNPKQNPALEAGNLHELNSKIVKSINEISLCSETFCLESSSVLQNTISNSLCSQFIVPSNSCINSVNNSDNADFNEQQTNFKMDSSKNSELLNLRKVSLEMKML